jgi:hypothetical protein
MKAFHRVTTIVFVLAILIATAAAQHVPAACTPVPAPVLYGTTGACNNVNQGGPCTLTSTLVELDPWTGALIRTIGQVGFTVNGLAWDPVTKKLFATTASGDVSFHGLITIDPKTGAGSPVDVRVVNFGLPIDPGGSASPIHSISIDSRGNMVGWYDEFGGAGVTDTFVRINKKSGVATEFTDTGINTAQNGVSFSDLDILWNIDAPRTQAGVTTQTAYLLNPSNGKAVLTRTLTPPTAAALGDFNPVTNLYYGLDFDAGVSHVSTIVLIDLSDGAVTTLSTTVDDLHTLAFANKTKKK